ncbi:MAG: hypothetical protein PHF00_12325 [Elusimicrobia bacterium]|nr:hypothetical protein [Elusimicrobiota bacterium]
MTAFAAALWLAAGAAWAQEAAPSTAAASTPDLIASLREAPESAERLRAVARLAEPPRRGDAVFAALARAMREDLSNEVRQAAAAALLDYEGRDAVGRVAEYLRQEKGEEARRRVCAAAAAAPAHADDPAVALLLAERLSEDESPAVRLAAVSGALSRRLAPLLGDLARAAAKDPDPAVRAAAGRAHKLLSIPEKVPKPRKKVERADYDAVKGRDRCPAPSGWCECARPPIQMKPRCIPRPDCAHQYRNTYQGEGFSCLWDGLEIR